MIAHGTFKEGRCLQLNGTTGAKAVEESAPKQLPAPTGKAGDTRPQVAAVTLATAAAKWSTPNGWQQQAYAYARLPCCCGSQAPEAGKEDQDRVQAGVGSCLGGCQG